MKPAKKMLMPGARDGERQGSEGKRKEKWNVEGEKEG